MNAILMISISLVVLLTISMFAFGTEINNDKNEKLTLAATFWPVYDLARAVVGDKGSVYSLVPSGVEPHDYEPSSGDIQKLNNADIFVTLGIEFEEFEEDLVNSVNPNVKVVPAGSGISLIKLSDEHEDEHHHSGEDPHIWLSPRNAQLMAQNIMNGLVSSDSSNVEYYEQTGKKLIEDLKMLDEEFEIGLSFCEKDVILVNHNAFSYLARDYGFTTIEISGLEPEAEPTPQQLAELIEEAEEHNLKYVFYEELVDSRIAETIANEVGAQTLELNPLEGTSDSSATYLSLMRKNLANLKIALEC